MIKNRFHTNIDKHTHTHPGKQIKIILARCKEVSIRHGYTELNVPYEIIDRPNRRSKRNGDGGVWVNIDGNSTFIWFFEFIPFIPPIVKKMVRLNPPIMKRTPREQVFKRTK